MSFSGWGALRGNSKTVTIWNLINTSWMFHVVDAVFRNFPTNFKASTLSLNHIGMFGTWIVDLLHRLENAMKFFTISASLRRHSSSSRRNYAKLKECQLAPEQLKNFCNICRVWKTFFLIKTIAPVYVEDNWVKICFLRLKIVCLVQPAKSAEKVSHRLRLLENAKLNVFLLHSAH